MTPEQQQEAIAIIKQTTSSHYWANWDSGVCECRYCNTYAAQFDNVVHYDYCPVARASELLTAIESEDAE